MKVQLRKGVFETNSSSTHTLTIYKKEDWENFKNGKGVIDEGWHDKKYSSKDEIMESEEFVEWLKDNYDSEDVQRWNDEERNDVLMEFMGEECIYDYESYKDQYEVLEKEIPDSAYVAVSIFSYEG